MKVVKRSNNMLSENNDFPEEQFNCFLEEFIDDYIKFRKYVTTPNCPVTKNDHPLGFYAEWKVRKILIENGVPVRKPEKSTSDSDLFIKPNGAAELGIQIKCTSDFNLSGGTVPFDVLPPLNQ